MVDIEGVPMTITTLAQESTATDQGRNKKGDTTKLKELYKGFRENGKTPINLMGKLYLYSGVLSKVKSSGPVKIEATKQNLEELLLGASVVEFRAFRGPKYDDNGVLMTATENGFIEYLNNTINSKNKTQIKFASNRNYKKNKVKGVDAYQRYMYRPYVILSYANDPNFKKVVLLYPKSRSVSDF
jgi:hypothetical protein